MIAIDTNLLVYAHRAAAPEHVAAIRALERAASDSRGWGFSVGSILEFWHVVTHSSASGRPSTPDEARRFLGNLERQGRARVWLPAPGFADRLLDAAARMRLTGGRIFDLQLALTALESGATEMWTRDAGFVRVPGLAIVDPLG
jgi:toxin-antitoxin system PIN domain toxin